jgi:hypothetical protein
MPRISQFFRNTQGQPTIEVFQWLGPASNVSVGTSAVAVPTTNTSRRKAVIFQNLHASQNVYIGGAVVEAIGKELQSEPISGHTVVTGQWHLSAAGTNEWYFAKADKTTSGMTQPTALYYALTSASPGVETLGTSGTVSALAAQHRWGWGDGDTLGYSTLYIRTDGSAIANDPGYEYRVILGYSSLPASGTGMLLGPGDLISITLDSSCRAWAIGSGAATTLTCVEVG